MTNHSENNHGQPLVWVLEDPRAGTAAQALGVADALGVPYVTKGLQYTWVSRLPNVLVGATTLGLTSSSAASFQQPWPDLVVAAGRRSAPVARAIKRKSSGKSRIVQIMFPGTSGLSEFDLVAVPNHDAVPAAPNLLPITGAPHRLTTEKLGAAREEWRDEFGELGRPLVALMVGGATQRRGFSPGLAETLGRQTAGLVSDGGTVLATTSRRTGREAADTLERIFNEMIPGDFRLHQFGSVAPNPYLGYLASADVLVVTGDSISMACEACATGKPVYIFAPEGQLSARHGRFVDELIEVGLARRLGASIEDWARPPPLDTARVIANEILERLSIR